MSNKKKAKWQDVDPDADGDTNINDLTGDNDNDVSNHLNTSTTSDGDFEFGIGGDDYFSAKTTTTTTSTSYTSNQTSTSTFSTATAATTGNNTKTTPTRTKLKLLRNPRPPAVVSIPDSEGPSFSILSNSTTKTTNNFQSQFSNTATSTFKSTPTRPARVPSPPTLPTSTSATPKPVYSRIIQGSPDLDDDDDFENPTFATKPTPSRHSPPRQYSIPSSPPHYSPPHYSPPPSPQRSFPQQTLPTPSSFKRLTKHTDQNSPKPTSVSRPEPSKPESTRQSRYQLRGSSDNYLTKSSTDDLEFDLTENSIGGDISYSECPICLRKIPTSFLETHAQQELDARERDGKSTQTVSSTPPYTLPTSTNRFPAPRRTFPSPPPSPPSPPRQRKRARTNGKKEKDAPKTPRQSSRMRKKIDSDGEEGEDLERGDDEDEGSDISDYDSDGGFVVHGSDEEAEGEEEVWEEWDDVYHSSTRELDRAHFGNDDDDVVEILDSSEDEVKPSKNRSNKAAGRNNSASTSRRPTKRPLEEEEYETCPICSKQIPKSQFEAHFEQERDGLDGYDPESAPQQRPKQQSSNNKAKNLAHLQRNTTTQSDHTTYSSDNAPKPSSFIQQLRQSNQSNTSDPPSPLSDPDVPVTKLHFTPLSKISADSAKDFMTQFDGMRSGKTSSSTRNTSNYNSNNNNNSFTSQYTNFNNNNSGSTYRSRNSNKNNSSSNKGNKNYKYRGGGYKYRGYRKYNKQRSSPSSPSEPKAKAKPKTTKTKAEKKQKATKGANANGRPVYYSGDSFSFDRGSGGRGESNRSFSLGGGIDD